MYSLRLPEEHERPVLRRFQRGHPRGNMSGIQALGMKIRLPDFEITEWRGRAGMSIDEARRPVILEKKGTRIGFLDITASAPRDMATPTRRDVPLSRFLTHYELDNRPGGATIYTFPDPVSFEAMMDDAQLRPCCSVLVVVSTRIGHTLSTRPVRATDNPCRRVDAGPTWS